jgi:hypothetical protein
MSNTIITISNHIYQCRGMAIIFDEDLAVLYQTETKQINRAVQRNKGRFPSDFAFQLTKEEWDSLRCQTGTSKSGSGGRRYLPFAFTEQGVAMLSAVLRTEVALKVSIIIIRAFVNFKKQNFQLVQMEERVEKIERNQLQANQRIDTLMNIFESRELPNQGIFFNNQIFDAYTFTSDLIKSAKESIVLLDNYVDETTLVQLSKRNARVTCTVYTEKITEQLNLDLEKHNGQYPPIDLRILKHVHDRFLIIDNKELYHLGASLKDLGKRWFAFSRMDGFLYEVLARLN